MGIDWCNHQYCGVIQPADLKAMTRTIRSALLIFPKKLIVWSACFL
ncbi:hypothetical protein GbCGDNIH3_7203 [Granulibacter bethesdensis]|uniref:Uncharacterized protein n=1 Tax=Granulibacter bethesdensis TaxID=364410 RepID=A0AAN0RBR5_9PROT|nr:hypothetical protein GbCGDNIH3_7203 [Granulibacter bethesdensis]APH58382.1 hypothetical protein GbCGDNIH7_7203 [Granulibacter bethesdensis]